jgi:hypothetical protein
MHQDERNQHQSWCSVNGEPDFGRTLFCHVNINVSSDIAFHSGFSLCFHDSALIKNDDSMVALGRVRSSAFLAVRLRQHNAGPNG